MKTRQEIESIARQKKRIRLMIIFAAALVVLATLATLLLVYFLNAEETNATSVEKPEIIDGEAYYRNYAIAYPQVEEKNITRITVRNVDEDGNDREYVIVRARIENHELVYDSSADYVFSYLENGEVKIYEPSILALESDTFSYSDLYAKETGDGYGMINKLTYLIAALEIPYFGERIPLSTNADEKANQLRVYGFSDEDDVKTLTFDYQEQTAGANTEDTSDDKYVTKTRKVSIGEKVLSGTGYYFMVTDTDGTLRPYIYNSNSNYYDYALMGLYSFVNGRLIAAGLTGDSSLEPTLVSDFTHWKNELYKEGAVFGDDSRVDIIANISVPLNPHNVLKNPSLYEGMNGYSVEEDKELLLELLKSFTAEKTALLGKEVGVYADGALEYTLVSGASESNKLTFDLDGNVVYNYTITAIESIVDVQNSDGSSSDNTTVGAPLTDATLIKVSYKFDINGDAEKKYDFISHAVIDLTSPLMPQDAVSKLRAAKVGELSEPIEFSIIYDKDNSTYVNDKFKITEILSILDQEGNGIKKIEEDSIVTFRFVREITTRRNGESIVEESEPTVWSVNFATDESARGEIIKNKLLGMNASVGLEIVAYENDYYYEIFNPFTTYSVEEIKYFVTQYEVISLSYLRYFERDPFYGESIYENNTDGYELYGIEATNCENIVRILGGADSDDSTSSAGLVGETIDIGITPEKLEKYGLYEHTIYYELPRGIFEVATENEDDPLDYDSYSKLGTTLYISREDSDGNRIVASDTFDVIAKIDGEPLEFLEENFVDFWARENLVMTAVDNMETIKLEFSMEDLVGNYDFTLSHRTGYLTVNSEGKTVQVFNEPESYIQTYDNITVKVKANGECTPNALTEYLSEKGTQQTTLTALYNSTVGGGNAVFVENSYDYLGTGCFKDAMRTLFFIKYEDSLSKEEQEYAIENGERVMKISFKIGGNSNRYAYEFYRFDDRRVLVKVYEESPSSKPQTTPVSDFYISTFGFKKIVGTFCTLLDGKEVDLDATFYDELGKSQN